MMSIGKWNRDFKYGRTNVHDVNEVRDSDKVHPLTANQTQDLIGSFGWE